MYIASREDLELELIRKIGQMNDDELVDAYEQIFKLDSVVIQELVDEEFIQQAIWDDLHVTVSVDMTDEGIEITPDSYQELCDAWDLGDYLDNGGIFADKMEELEKFWSDKVGKNINKIL